MEDSAKSASSQKDPRAESQEANTVEAASPAKVEHHEHVSDRSGLTQRLHLPWPKRARIAAAAYGVSVVFAIGAGTARAVGASVNSALIVGVLVAGPLVIALMGERITGFKLGGVEISLKEVTVAVETDFSGTAMKIAESGPSATPELLSTIESLMQNRSKLLRINLRDGNYWWSTRIFLVAALAQEYTEVEALIFVRSYEERIFVGIASPRATRERIANRNPTFELAYRKARAELAQPAIGPVLEVKQILEVGWQSKLWQLANQPEETIKENVSSDKLREWLRDDLDTEALPYGPLTASRRLRIISRDRRYAALTDQLQIVDVVDRNELALRSALRGLNRLS
jgi:hypothetical protein